MQKKAIGFVLVLAGFLLLAAQTGWAKIPSMLTWPFLLFILGSIIVFISFLQRQPQLTVIGGVIGAIGLSVWGFRYVPDWPKHWSILVLMIGIVIFLQYMQNKNNMTLVVACVLLLCGFFANPAIGEIAVFAPIADVLNSYWPVFIVGLGLLFLFKK